LNQARADHTFEKAFRRVPGSGLVLVRVSADDGRVKRADLTSTGLAERAELDQRSEVLAARLLEPLSGRQRAMLVAAMTDVERLVQATMVRFAIEDPATPHAKWCFEQYFGGAQRAL
jgi:hypothetical protein